MNLNSLLSLDLGYVTKVKQECMEKLVGAKLSYQGEGSVLNLGRCLMFWSGNFLLVETCSSAKRYKIRKKKRGEGYTKERIK